MTDRERVVVEYKPRRAPRQKLEFVPLESSDLWLRKTWTMTTTGEYRVTGTEHVEEVTTTTMPD